MTHPSDKVLFAQIDRATAGGRALLCTLARLGKALRRDQPARAEMLLLASQAHPLYKGGRLLFDLLELEDLMLEGPPPEPLDYEALTGALRSTTGAFADLVRALVGFAAELSRSVEAEPAAATPELEPLPTQVEQEPSPSWQDLPQLDASEYLYDWIALGIVSELSRAVAGDGRKSSNARSEEPSAGSVVPDGRTSLC